MKKKGLGRGLGSLLREEDFIVEENLINVPLDKLIANATNIRFVASSGQSLARHGRRLGQNGLQTHCPKLHGLHYA